MPTYPPDLFVVPSTSPAPPQDDNVRHLNIPPHSIEAERVVLGGLMLHPDALDLVHGHLVEQDFYRRDHQLIFRAILELAARYQPFDAVTVLEWLASTGLLGQAGGAAYPVELARTTLSAANIRAYINIVKDKAIMRELIRIGNTIISNSYQPEGRSSAELLSEAEKAIFAVAEKGAPGRSDFVLLKDALKDAFAELQRRFNSKHPITGLATGYHDFDRMTSGLQPSDLIILAARPAMGKTALALNIAEYAASHVNKSVAVFSMEMSTEQLAMRLVSSYGRINAQAMRTGQLNDIDWPRVSEATQTLKQSNIFIDDATGLSPEILRSKCRRLKRDHDLGLIVVDYLQLMSLPGSNENRATEISVISRSLKMMAKELNVPVLALSQLNRSLESRTDKRPNMSDLRESGAIEQDADMVVFIYRDEYYNPNSPDKGLAEIIISKHRSGPTGHCKLKFFGEYTRFENLSQEFSGTFEPDHTAHAAPMH